ncbi:MAG: Gfo/Idh/MocA family oxidoreductase, partial [Methyloprofundus sp.]|nr:Gfo/Idh/MocA family oxidoreductase [Methyloprofundus sp.]
MLKFALLGCGRIAKRHSELLGHGQIENAKLVAVCDIVEEKAKKIGEQFGVPYFTDMNEML